MRREMRKRSAQKFWNQSIKRRGAAESSMDFTYISPPRFARRRVPRFARPGLASLGWGSLRSPEARFARLGLASLACGSLRSAGVSAYLGTVLVHMYTCTYSSIGGANIPVTLKHITGMFRKCVNLQLGY
jgi:hypothetical protein